MRDVFITALQSITSVILLFLFTRMMGKKQISQLTFFDYVVGISIGSIAAEFAVNESINYLKGITGLIIYAIFPITLSFISIKSYRGRKLLDGLPAILIQNGQIIEANLIKAKLNVNDLLEECRIKNSFDIADVECAILETSGRLSLLLKSQNQPVTPKDLNIQTQYKGLCTNLIIDGKILHQQLQLVGKDPSWLLDELQKKNIANTQSILLAYLDTSGQLHIHQKNNDTPNIPVL